MEKDNMRTCMGNVYLCSHKIKNKYIILKNYISDTRIKLTFQKPQVNCTVYCLKWLKVNDCVI